MGKGDSRFVLEVADEEILEKLPSMYLERENKDSQ